MTLTMLEMALLGALVTLLAALIGAGVVLWTCSGKYVTKEKCLAVKDQLQEYQEGQAAQLRAVREGQAAQQKLLQALVISSNIPDDEKVELLNGTGWS